MALDLNQIKQILQKPSKRQTIQKASLLQKRLRFHTETNTAVSDINLPTSNFIDWVNHLLPKDKFNTFLHLFKFPLPTPAITEDVYRDLERVFDSRNSSSSYQFSNGEIYDDWQKYKRENLHEPEIWKTAGWNKMKVSPNSVLIVDLPQSQTSLYPEPYFYWLDIENVIDYETPDGTELNWIVFKQPCNKVAVFELKQLFTKEQIKEILAIVDSLGAGALSRKKIFLFFLFSKKTCYILSHVFFTRIFANIIFPLFVYLLILIHN